MARYRKYRYGGKNVPGMYKAQPGTETPMNPVPPNMQSVDPKPIMNSEGSTSTGMPKDYQNFRTLSGENVMNLKGDSISKSDAVSMLIEQQLRFDAQLQQIKNAMQMQQVASQNQTKMTEVQNALIEKTNEARTFRGDATGPMNSPRKYGGSSKKTLPMGRFSKRKRR